MPERANDLGFAGFHIVLRDAEPVFLLEREDKGNELFVAYAGAEFPIEQIAGGLGQRRLVDFVNCLMQRFDIEQAVFHMGGVVL